MTSPVRAAGPSLRRKAVTAVGSALLLALPLGVAGCGGPDRLEGTVVSVDDTGKGDRPLGGGWVAAFGDDALLGFLSEAGIDVPGSADLPYVGGRVLHDDVTRSGGSLAAIDQDGTFTLTVTGRHTVCRLLEAPQVDLLKGCAVVDLPAKGRLKLSVGKAGLRAALDG
jgi:hypothetical protein